MQSAKQMSCTSMESARKPFSGQSYPQKGPSAWLTWTQLGWVPSASCFVARRCGFCTIPDVTEGLVLLIPLMLHALATTKVQRGSTRGLVLVGAPSLCKSLGISCKSPSPLPFCPSNPIQCLSCQYRAYSDHTGAQHHGGHALLSSHDALPSLVLLCHFHDGSRCGH